ncbi:MAG: hypoxanthine phosphoribosyltransferase, partial [Terrimicrobiaceae bacterium]|nr:hypoxanthine phosphoribosyltransferase [Terrimicrobiaceae bacterium]
MTAPDMQDDIAKVLLTERQILTRLDEVAEGITRDFRGRPMTVVGILNGSCLFLGDLLRRIPLPLTVDCVSVASYHGGMSSSGRVELVQKSLPAVRGRSVLLVDDILDTGRTLAAVRALLAEEAGAAEIRCCVLLRKAVERAVAIEADYVAFEIPNEFVVGYGLDYMGHYRN